MRYHVCILYVSVVLLAGLQQVLTSGVFELRLKSFINDYGKDSVGQCCSGGRPSAAGECSGPCRTRFRVCLKHYQTRIDTTSPCTFGDVVTPVLGENSVLLSGSARDGFQNPIRFPFDFQWPGTFSLIVEALHDNNGNSSGGRTGGESLITRLTMQRWLDVGEAWTQEEHRSAHSVMRYEYRVTCDAQYYAPGCTTLCRPRDDSFGHYNCSELGERVCMAGWQGDYCTKPRCLPGCHEQHGTCQQPSECMCHSGWKGRLCDECERYPGCLHGTCQNQWECLCDEGWGGLFCNQDLNYCTNHKPCRNGGTCFNTGQGSYTCSCSAGFTGSDCEREVDDCARHPCLNGGVCKESGAGSYRCDCPKGWHGPHCETSTRTCDDLPCRNSATCQDVPAGYVCQCPPGYTGADCEHEVDDCAPLPCRNNATCVDRADGFECVCPRGFSGPTCENNDDDCHGNPCLNGGTCVDLVADFRCQCVPGYVGALCGGFVDYCRTKPCANGGACTNLVNDYRCACRPGFTGKDCSTDVDECSSAPCRNGGTCVNRVNGYACRCAPGLGGPRCDGEASTTSSTTQAGWPAGDISRHVSEQAARDAGLSTEHVVVIATLSTAVPLVVLVAAVAVACAKRRRRREKRRADDEARMQNEQNAVQGGVAKRAAAGDAHMIKNTWGKCVNNAPAGGGGGGDDGGGGGGGGDGELCYPKLQAQAATDSGSSAGPVYSLQRTWSHKQLNTDAAVHRPSNRASALLGASAKLEKDYDNLCPGLRVSSTPSSDKRISVLSVDSSLCNTSDSSLLKRPQDKDISSASPATAGQASSVYVIDEHFHHPEGLLATEV
ncbi:neurogenic locus protein delta [Bacillus rossius redtenbacheri]|uniref:neurogenic locus protein delta n=1 Tax=Bacillus rossius redtenbacheri TaxID=93214 RepID=UPI002FDE6975